MTLHLLPPPYVANLRLNSHAAQLAVACYCHHQQLYQLEVPDWEHLSGPEKQVWIARAADWLRDLAPQKCIYCRVDYQRPGSDYCSTECSVQAETDR